MEKNKDNLKAALASVRASSRNARSGKGVSGKFNPDRSVRFDTPTNKYDARGRTYRDDS